jgi:hypothetical protein
MLPVRSKRTAKHIYRGKLVTVFTILFFIIKDSIYQVLMMMRMIWMMRMMTTSGEKN